MKYKPKNKTYLPVKETKSQLDLDNLTEEQINELLEQGITLDQMVKISKEQGKKTPKLISDMIKKKKGKNTNNTNNTNKKKNTKKSKKKKK